MGYPREAVAELLLPVFLPFNLVKGGLNTAITLLLYKPVVTALRRAKLIDVSSENHTEKKSKIGIILVALLLLATCVFFALVLKGVI